MRLTAVAGAFLVFALLLAPAGEAHKGITSRFTFNAEVYPVFLSRCSRCHVDGGVGPMSLVKYEDAFPWAESLRTELLQAQSAEPHDFVKAAHRQISARELDIVLDWATGGTPEGDKSAMPAEVALKNDWARGAPPDVSIAMRAPFEMPADALEATQEFVLPVSVAEPKNVTHFDVLPGNPAIVRSAAVTLRFRDGQSRMLGTWFPRQTPTPLALKPPARLEPGSELIARVHYKKTWKFEGKAMTDRSTVGFYVAD